MLRPFRLELETEMEALASTPLLDDRFLLFESLGRGGMARVYRAFDSVERRLVAVKVADDASEEPERAHPFAAEFEAWCRLRHPNIIRAYELGRTRRGPLPAGTPYLVLESFSGRPAHHTLAPGHVGADRLEEFARRVLHALDHVHEANLVHRDLKPANILVGPARRGPGRVKLTDFGLAAEAGRSGEPGRLSGSIPYVAPESILGLPLDGRADLYSLGIVLHFLAAGRMPVESRDPTEILRWHLAGSAADSGTALRDLPEKLARFILRLMERNRDDRPSSADEALFLLGASNGKRRRPLLRCVGRAELATLRLALDAVRCGSRRLVRLPSDPRAASALVGEARALAQVHGLALCRLAADGRRGGSSLGRIVLRLLLAHGSRARALVEKHSLHVVLPIGLVGDLPVWDRTRPGWEMSGPDPRALDVASRRIAGFLLEASTRQGLVLVVERGALHGPLAGRVVERLEAAVRSGKETPAPAGALLLVMDGAARLRRCRHRPVQLRPSMASF